MKNLLVALLNFPTRAAVLAAGLFVALMLAGSVGEAHGPLAGAVAGFVAFAAVSATLARREAACFANNFGVLNNTTLLHDAFSMFLEDLIPVANLVLDVSDPKTGARDAKPGDTITIKDWRNEFTVYEVGAAGYNQPSNIGAADTQVTLPNTAKAVSFVLTPPEYRVIASGSTGGADYMAFRTKLRLAMQQSLGLGIVADMFAIVTAANYPNYTVSAPGTFSRATEVDLDSKLFARKVPRINAQGILSGAAYGEWTKDHIAIQTNTDTGRTLPRDLLLDGGMQSPTTPFRFFRTSLEMPEDADRGFVTTKTAMIGAFRIPSEPTYDRDPVSLLEVVDAKTGVPLLVRLWKNAQTGAIQVDCASIWKFQKGQAEALERIVSAAPAP